MGDRLGGPNDTLVFTADDRRCYPKLLPAMIRNPA
jgi:hypothetical protein